MLTHDKKTVKERSAERGESFRVFSVCIFCTKTAVVNGFVQF